MEVSIAEGMDKVDAAAWDALIDPNDPFVTHAFLQSLETSGSVGEGSGWLPVHLLVYDNDALVAAAPVYLKNHSYGEYIFDWGWAEASRNAGIPYYPKLVSAVPFTPATGQRLITKATDPSLINIMWSGLRALAKACEAWSIHVLFQPKSELLLLSQNPEVLPRYTHQYHWLNPGVASFDEWLGLFRSKDRKKLRRERQKAQEAVDRIYSLRGHELEQKHIQSIWQFYRLTTMRKWGQAYLNKAFFESLATTLADQSLVFFAEKDGEIVASALNFQRGQHLYGRYWGCRESYDCLHFELCYHQAIETCINNGWQRFEAGAQGQHKIKRGLLPQTTYSSHWLRHQGLQQGVKLALQREAEETEHHIQVLTQHGPFRREQQ